MSLVYAIAGLLALVFIHELGHFLGAKATGMGARKFYVGFPPPLIRRRVRGTEYGIGAIPLGGYVKIPGMLRPAPADVMDIELILERSERLPEDAASAIAVRYEAVRRDLERGRFDDAAAAARELRAELERDAEHLSEAEMRRARRCLDRLDDALGPDTYWRAPRLRRLIVILAGVAATGQPQPAEPTMRVAAVEAGTPAASAGLRTGDRIVGINGHRVTSFRQVRAAIQGSHGRPVTLTVLRQGRDVQLRPVTPIVRGNRYIIGFSPDARYVTKAYPVWQAPGQALSGMWRITSGTVRALADIPFSRDASLVSSTVGIVDYSARAADLGAPYYFTLGAVISLSLAIFNLLPFLPLDGGHAFLIGLERLRGRAVSRATFERVSALGIVLMLFVFFVGLHNDLSRLTGTQGP
ncbi:MAG: M50 family metallopeptidase [Gaiellales bacterium]